MQMYLYHGSMRSVNRPQNNCTLLDFCHLVLTIDVVLDGIFKHLKGNLSFEPEIPWILYMHLNIERIDWSPASKLILHSLLIGGLE